jgi:glycine dehydrogenase
MYAVFHGPVQLKKIAQRIHLLAAALNNAFAGAGIRQVNSLFFDTVCFEVENTEALKQAALENKTNFRYLDNGMVCISFDEPAAAFYAATVVNLETIFRAAGYAGFKIDLVSAENLIEKNNVLNRRSSYLLHPHFNTHHSETQMMRYIKQ